MKSVILLVALFAIACTQQFNYEAYKVYRVWCTCKEDVDLLIIISNYPQVDFWSPLQFGRDPVAVMVGPIAQAGVEIVLRENNLRYEIWTNNVENLVKAERARQQVTLHETKGWFTRYPRHSEINAHLDQLAKLYCVSVEIIGKSYEGRDLKVIKLSLNASANNPVIFIDAGFSGREWATSAQATYIINQSIEIPNHVHLLQNVDWHILPVVNPDGYEYTHTRQRFWTKTRSKGVCYGTDANRNFGFHWGEVGVSTAECSDFYMGPTPFSEVETQAVRNYITKNKYHIKLYLSFQSYGGNILYPWGYTSSMPNDYLELKRLGESVANAIEEVDDTRYTVGSSANVLYPIAGGSADWAKGVVNVKLSYKIGLRSGRYIPFAPPPSELFEIMAETWSGLLVYHYYIQSKFCD